MSLFDGLFQLFIPDSLRRDEDDLAKAKNQVGLVVVAVLAAPPFAALYAWLGNTAGAWGIAMALPMLMVGVVCMRWLGSLKLAQVNAMVSLWGLFCFLQWTLGGHPKTAVAAWFVAVPVVATFMGGLRQGLFWLAMSLAAMGFFAWASFTGAVSFPVNPVTDMVLLDTLSNLGLVPFVSNTLESTSGNLARGAEVARDSAVEGAQVVGEAIATSAALAQAIDQADGLVRQMQARSRQVGGTVDRIKGLAFQTNILALNATIEAAHAGAQGRGFAVVADNVRKLAGEAGDAATAISQELGVILEHIQRTASLLDDSQGLAASGRANADHARQALQAIEDAVMGVYGEMSQLQNVSERQSQQNQSLQTVAGRIETGITEVVTGSSAIRDSMAQLHDRLHTLAN
jgi:hypothetical protein